MYRQRNWLFRYLAPAITAVGALIGWSSPGSAFVNKIVIDQTVTANFNPVPLGSSTASSTAVSYTIYYGRIFGTLNPSDPHNTIITDIGQAAPVGGSNSYISNFQIITPTDPTARSGLLINGVSNRGGSAISTSSMIAGATYVQNGWQGDLLSECSLVTPAPYPCVDLSVGPYGTMSATGVVTAPNATGAIVAGTTKLTPFVIQVPIATTDGTAPNGSNNITGVVYSHVAPLTTGNTAQLIIGNSASVGGVFTPYQTPNPADNTGAQLWSISSQTLGGVNTGKTIIPNANWSWANCPTGSGGVVTPSTTWICLPAATFNPALVYEITFPVSNPLVLGVGYASTRDFISFLRYGTTAPISGTNPIAGTITKAMTIGSSQSGAFIRGSIFYGFNQDENNKLIFEGAWPQIDGRMLWLNERWAQPTVLTQLYMGGEEAPVWWADFPNQARNLPADGILHRCTATNSCPQILEHYGALEYYGEKMGADMTGYCSPCTSDIPLPSNVYRYFLPGTTHGGGAGGFNWAAPGSLSIPAGQSAPTSPVAESQTTNALQSDFIQLLMNGTPMPPSVGGVTYPTLASGQLVVNTQAGEGFPTIPGFAYGGNGAWTPMLYNFGPDVNYDQETGVPTIQPPGVTQLQEYVPHAGPDGNSIGGSVPSVLFSAPLGTYVGWNLIPASPPNPYVGQQDSLTGGWWPFYDTKANRTAASDPRLSLEERYGSHTGYNCVARQAAFKSVRQRFLFAADAATLITQAAASTTILPAPFVPTTADQGVVNTNCEFTTTHGFTSNAHSDILWRDTAGDVGIWSMNGTTISATAVLGNVPNNWTVFGQHDFDGDGMADILWRDTSGNVGVWLMNGTTPVSQVVVANVPTTWTVVGTGDFNGDGKSDILWRDSSGNVGIWLMNGTTVGSTAFVGNVPTNWTIAGTGDFNGDGMTDILWRDASGNVGIWLMNGTTPTSQVVVANAPASWTIVGTGDFNSDGKTDILWRDSSGNVGIWIMNGTAITTTAGIGNVPSIWSVAETGDFNGDGMSDILWRDSSGNVGVWLMNGTTVSSTASIGNVPNVWAIQSANAD
jgi:Alpha/beta hydrolase domain/FG-GAP-like repeat